MKTIIITILVMVVVIMGAFMLSSGTNGFAVKKESVNLNNVSVVDGKQIIEIKVKGGYNPEESVAKAGIPTIVRFDTNGTFDCSSSVRVPDLDISKSLPQTGSTDIDIGTPKAGVFNGTCGMGMYPFDIKFE